MFDEIYIQEINKQKNLLEQLRVQVMNAPPNEQAKFNGFMIKIKKVFDLPIEEQAKAITELQNEFINNFS